MLTAALFVISASFFRFLHIHSIWKSFSLMWAKDGPQNIKKKRKKILSRATFHIVKKMFLFLGTQSPPVFLCHRFPESSAFPPDLKGKIEGVDFSHTNCSYAAKPIWDSPRSLPHSDCDYRVVWYVCSSFTIPSTIGRSWSWMEEFYEQHNFHRHDHQHHHLICSTTCTRPKHLIFPLSLSDAKKLSTVKMKEEKLWALIGADEKKLLVCYVGRWTYEKHTTRIYFWESRFLCAVISPSRDLRRLIELMQSHEQCWKLFEKFSNFCTHFKLHFLHFELK